MHVGKKPTELVFNIKGIHVGQASRKEFNTLTLVCKSYTLVSMVLQ